jgi:hypothetical protein
MNGTVEDAVHKPAACMHDTARTPQIDICSTSYGLSEKKKKPHIAFELFITLN